MPDTPPLMTGIALAMKNLSERQRVIAQNIANGDTPGFKAREVEGPDFASLLDISASGNTPHVGRPNVQISSRMSELGARGTTGVGTIVLDQNVSETKPDGNNVTLEDQMLKMGQIQAEFNALTNLYRKQSQLLKIALGKGN